jgi:hypothetical protein
VVPIAVISKNKYQSNLDLKNEEIKKLKNQLTDVKDNKDNDVKAADVDPEL